MELNENFRTDLRIELVDLLNGCLNISSVDSIADFDASLYGLLLRCVDVRFHSKLPSGLRIALVDEIIHDDEIDVTVGICVSLCTQCFMK